MKGRVIALTANPCHAALIVDGRIEDLLFTTPGDVPRPGAIREAKVTRKLPGDSDVFVDLGDGVQGFLRDAKGLQTGDVLAVMTTSLPEPGKAVPVTRRILIKGRSLILTPGAPGVNVSRQIRDPETRARLTDAVSLPDAQTGAIIRSAAADLDAEIIAQECRDLSTCLPDPAQNKGVVQVPGEMVALAQALREWTTPAPDMIAAPEELERLLDWDTAPWRFHHDPDLADALRFGEGDPFDHFGVWDQIESLRPARADLASGGWMAIEATRAMVTVDVNTGDQFGGGAAMTANIEAARELPRQLRLRGFGGQIIIDFAPMKKSHRKKIEETLKSAFRRDLIDTSLAGWTPLGNFEMHRKRERPPLSALPRD